MGEGKIFLSYRRDDSPGYVSRLEHELERAFGAGRVFRDVEDIKGGTQWKVVLEQNLADAAVVLLIIGPRWQEIWEARRHDAGTNYVALELSRARAANVPVIPVTVSGGRVSRDTDLGEIAWIRDHQTYDISDTQGRWSSDLSGLIELLEGIEGIGAARRPDSPAKPATKASSPLLRRIGIVAAALVALAILVAQLAREPHSGAVPPSSAPPVAVATKQTAPGQAAPASPAIDRPAPSAALAVPDIAGTWHGGDGTVYFVQQFTDGTFRIESPGYTSGTGRFMDRMPNKFEVKMDGVGSGEFSVTTDGRRIIGYIVVDGRQEFDTLTRME